MGVEAGFLGELQRAVEEALKQDCRWRQGARSNRRAALPIDWEELKTTKSILEGRNAPESAVVFIFSIEFAQTTFPRASRT
jgi:hypothetical protein